ncbi:hypothetical protein HDV06_002279 [Boothiomyces sp. JEL0866]|nr:hypothetical protein HDV06_002279 [Boothiomyces sp. JEL0866]
MTQLTNLVYYKIIVKIYSIVDALKHFINPQENYWRQKCIELQEQNKQLQKELSQERESRALIDKLYINAKARIDEREMQLEEFLSKELEMCQGCQKFTSQPEFIEYQDEEDEETINFEERARETITQLLVSNSNPQSICISLADIALKTDASDLDCVRIALISIVDYLKLNNKLNEDNDTHLLYNIGVVSVASILKHLQRNHKEFDEWLSPGLSNYKYHTEKEPLPSNQAQISWSPIRNKREYYIPTDDDIETETIIYDEEEELEIEFVDE